MRKIINLFIIMALVISFTGCSAVGKKDNTGDNSVIVDSDKNNNGNNGNKGGDNTGDKSDKGNNNDDKDDIGNTGSGEDTTDINDNEEYTFLAQVISSDSTVLVTPDKDSNEIKSSDRIAVSINDGEIFTQAGMNISKLELIPGDIVKITYDGNIRESYPAQITASMFELIGRNIIIDGYLALIKDIYNEDPGLNGDITMIALDTTQWTDVTDIDKEIILQHLRETYGLDVIEATFHELSEQGLIDMKNLYFPQGVLISIKEVRYNVKTKTITCSIEKWRSGLGAIGADEVTAKYRDGQWVITKSGMWIS